MKFYFFLVVAGIQWCYSTQESSLFLGTSRLLHVSREDSHRAKRELTFPSDREQTSLRHRFLPSTIPGREKHRITEIHGVTKREVTAEEIIRKLPRVYEPGSATRYSYPSQNFRSLVDQTYLFESTSTVTNEKADTEANEHSRNSSSTGEGISESEISATKDLKEQVENATAIPTSPASSPENNGYDFLLKQLQKFKKKSSNKTANVKNSHMKLPYETNSTVHESHKGNSTKPIFHKTNEFENQTLSVSETANVNQSRTYNQTSKNQSTLEMDNEEAEYYDGVGPPPKEAYDELAEHLQSEESSLGRGRPRIIFPDTSTFGLEATEDTQEAGSEIRKSHPIFKIKEPLIYSNSDKASAKSEQISSNNMGFNTTNLVTDKSSGVNVTGNSTVVQASAQILTKNAQNHSGSDEHAGTGKLKAFSTLTIDQPKAVNENNESNTSHDSTIFQDSKVLSLALNPSPKINTSSDGDRMIVEIKNDTSVLQKPLFKAENQPLSFLSGYPDLIQSFWNTELNQSTTLQNETSLKNPLHSLSHNFTGLLHNVPISPARLLPQNILGYNFNPSKPFNIHSPHTPTSPFSSSSSGLLGLDSLGFGPWSPPSYLPNAGSADFTASRHFGASNLALPSSLGGPSISPNPSTLGGVDLGGLDFLSLLSSLGGFNSASVPSAVDLSSPDTRSSPYPIGSTSFQSTPLNQIILKRFGLPDEQTTGKAFESTAATDIYSSFSDKTGG